MEEAYKFAKIMVTAWILISLSGPEMWFMERV
jgi:hypothetical protein